MKKNSSAHTLTLCLAISTITGLTSGCSGGGDGTENIQNDTLNALLNGTWTTGCLAGPDISVLANVTFNNGKGIGEVSTFSDSTCSNISSIENETFDYSFGSELIVDGSIAGITTATQLNSTDTTQGSLSFGEIDYDIFAIKDLITLYLGDSLGSNDGSTPALRPTQLFNLPLTRQ